MTLEEYAKKVQECRIAQKNFFKITKDPMSKSLEKSAALTRSKQLEKELDELTNGILHKETSTPELFT